MELSVREAKARFAEVAAAAARGERVVVTKHGHPFVELVPARRTGGVDFEKAARVRRELRWAAGAPGCGWRTGERSWTPPAGPR